jgi:hypothetical protein
MILKEFCREIASGPARDATTNYLGNRLLLECATMVKPSFAFAVITLSMFSASAAFAELYKWKDEQGQIHYTQTPPPGGKDAAETVRATKAPTGASEAQKRLDEKLKQFDAGREQRVKASEEKKAAEAEEAKRKENCEMAKRRLNGLEGSNRIFEYDSKGERNRLGEEQRQAHIEETKKQIADLCGPKVAKKEKPAPAEEKDGKKAPADAGKAAAPPAAGSAPAAPSTAAPAPTTSSASPTAPTTAPAKPTEDKPAAP